MIKHSEYPRAVSASVWNAAVAIGLVIGLVLPIAGAPVAEPAPQPPMAAASDASGYDNYLQLVKRAAMLRIGASEAEAADIVAIQGMLAGYRELHAQAVAAHRAGDAAQAHRLAALCANFLEEIRHDMTRIGQNAGIGQDETTPVPVVSPAALVVAAR